MAKPSKLPRWADVGGAILEPNTAKKDIGHIPGERPGAQFLNWLFNLIYQWLLWISESVIEHKIHVAAIKGYAVNGPWTLDSFLGRTTTFTADQQLFYAPDLAVGSRITSITVRVAWDEGGSNADAFARIARVKQTGTPPGNPADIEYVSGTTLTITDNSNTYSEETHSFSITVEQGWTYYVTAEVDNGSGGTPTFSIAWWELGIDGPA